MVDKAIESSWLSFYPLKYDDVAIVKNNSNVILTKEQQKALEAPSIPPIIKDIQEKAEKCEPLTSDEKDLLSIYEKKINLTHKI